jgi:hypothetical protein
MERELIEAAVLRNPDLKNKHYNKRLPFKIIGVPLGTQAHARGKKGAAGWVSRMLRND